MTKPHRQSFRRNPVAAALLLALTSQFSGNVALANGAYGTNTNLAGTQIVVPTYYANSPQGIQKAFDPATGLISDTVTVDTGTPLRKFVDPMAGAYNGLDGNGIPVAIAEKWVDLSGKTTGDDYYEMAVVEYTQRMHSDLAKETRLRGYVQIETPAIAAGLKDATGVIGSEHIQAFYPDGVTPIKNNKGELVYFVHKPHYLGPVILAERGKPVRMKATNYLPYTDASGKSVGSWNGTGGELATPVDETIAGGGPILDKDGNPVVDANGKPIKMAQNRAGIHWHGGDTPWISDGTPHQWFAPAGDISYTLQKDAAHPNGLGKGDSAQSIPDMEEPGDGAYTLYFPNNLSGRMMFYHDHTSGLTRINVYQGEAAGYVIRDPVEKAMIAVALNTPLSKTANGLPTGELDNVGIPLVFQDKTFVPKNIGPNAVAADGYTPQSQDAKWDLAHWGQPGDLYSPHVYETNQDPNSADGTNPVGRWDWGPWFWPVFPAEMSLPSGEYGHVTLTPEAFMDTAVVNGQAYPTMTVDPKAYRFRMLNAGNDRTLNLGLYQAVDAAGKVCDGKLPVAANRAANGIVAGGLAPASCTEVRMVAALPTAGFPADWPTDGRVGGVPDPATAGPDIVQIGNEAGLLPGPAIWKSQPVTYDMNVRSITLLNILKHDLLLGNAERADVLIDFSKYAGQTLIVYNDAPTPMPALDPRTDYMTGGGDKTDAGGAHDTLPGYGPNTRTFMQIKVNATNISGTGGVLDVAKLAAAMPKAYALSQPAPNIPEAAYNAAFGTSSTNNYAAIGTGSGANPNFTYTDGKGVKQTLPIINKAIQELFDPVYGRMNATLAVELPFSTATVATTIPLNYVDLPVERLDAIKDGETQIWKITHNGVDGHPVHFHLVNVQVINRVSWDGTIKPPEANEVGWKETLRMNPLEDVYVAVKASRPSVPFGVPRSSRALDPAAAINSTVGFTNIDPTTGGAPTFQTIRVDANGLAVPIVPIVTNMPNFPGFYSNQITDFDNEYVWHCHILGHEENDFMRPFIFHPTVLVPDAPGAVTVTGTTVSWTDTTPVGGQDAQGIPTAGTNAAYPEPTSSPKNEIGYKVYADGVLAKTLRANVTSWTDLSGAVVNAYTVVAYNAAGDSAPGTSNTAVVGGVLVGAGAAAGYQSTGATVATGPAGPTGLTQTVNANKSVTLSWTAMAGATGYVVTVNGVAQPTVLGTSLTIAANLLKAGSNQFSVKTLALSGNSTAVTADLYNGKALGPVAVTATQGNQGGGAARGSITLNWANAPKNVNNVTGINLSWQGGSMTFDPKATGTTIIGLQRAQDYAFTLVANSPLGNSPQVQVTGITVP